MCVALLQRPEINLAKILVSADGTGYQKSDGDGTFSACRNVFFFSRPLPLEDFFFGVKFPAQFVFVSRWPIGAKHNSLLETHNKIFQNTKIFFRTQRDILIDNNLQNSRDFNLDILSILGTGFKQILVIKLQSFCFTVKSTPKYNLNYTHLNPI